MPSILLKNIPPELHKRLKVEAKKARRSMSQEALYLLESVFSDPKPLSIRELPAPYKLSKPVSEDQLNRWKRDGME